MNRQINSGSRLVAFHEIKKNWLKHEDRLIHIKPTLNTRSNLSRGPSSKKSNYIHSLQIELQNKALLKKLTDRVQNRQDMSMCSQNNSLPKSNRRRYYQEHKIKCQNQGLYLRLKHTKPMYDTERILNQRSTTEKYINTISKFGYKNLKPNKTIIKFDLHNNELKYLSRRKIIIDEKLKNNDSPVKMHTLANQSRVIQMQNQKYKNNQKLFSYFSRPKQITIDTTEVLLKISRGSTSLLLELKCLSDKQNQAEQVQVKIPRTLFKERFKDDLESLIENVRYNSVTNFFYIV